MVVVVMMTKLTTMLVLLLTTKAIYMYILSTHLDKPLSVY